MTAQIEKVERIESLTYKGLLYERYPSQELMTWIEANAYVKKLNQNSLGRWRLASVNELKKLFAQPNKQFFKNLNLVWSKDRENMSDAWIMDFNKNFYYLRNKELKYRLLAVQESSLKKSLNFF